MALDDNDDDDEKKRGKATTIESLAQRWERNSVKTATSWFAKTAQQNYSNAKTTESVVGQKRTSNTSDSNALFLQHNAN